MRSSQGGRSATVLGDSPGTPLVSADSATRAQLPPGRQAVSLAAQPIPQQSGGTKWSDIYVEWAEKARREGRTGDAVEYRGLSLAKLETEVATSRMVSNVANTFAIYAGTMQALRAVGQASVDGTAVKLRDWIISNTGAIGPEAPTGSVLNLQLFQVLNGQKFKSEMRLDVVAIATLDDGRGRTVQSARTWQIWGRKREGSALEVPSDATPWDAKHIVPADRQRVLEPLSKNAWGPHLALAANAAVADLYASLAVLAGEKPPARD